MYFFTERMAPSMTRYSGGSLSLPPATPLNSPVRWQL
jgi:hypothetical protein